MSHPLPTARRGPGYATVLPGIAAGVLFVAAVMATVFAALDGLPGSVVLVAVGDVSSLRVPPVLVLGMLWGATVALVLAAVAIRRSARMGVVRWGAATVVALAAPALVGLVTPTLLAQTGMTAAWDVPSTATRVTVTALLLWAFVPATIVLVWLWFAYGAERGRGRRSGPVPRGAGKVAEGITMRLSKRERDDSATFALDTLRSRPQPPDVGETLQVELPNGSLLTMWDVHLKGRRTLVLLGGLPAASGRRVLSLLSWPRDQAALGGWFTWPMSEAEESRVVRRLRSAVAMAAAGLDAERLEQTHFVSIRQGVARDGEASPSPEYAARNSLGLIDEAETPR